MLAGSARLGGRSTFPLSRLGAWLADEDPGGLEVEDQNLYDAEGAGGGLVGWLVLASAFLLKKPFIQSRAKPNDAKQAVYGVCLRCSCASTSLKVSSSVVNNEGREQHEAHWPQQPL